jgi:hypothetical protein
MLRHVYLCSLEKNNKNNFLKKNVFIENVNIKRENIITVVFSG